MLADALKEVAASRSCACCEDYNILAYRFLDLNAAHRTDFSWNGSLLLGHGSFLLDVCRFNLIF